MKKLLAMALSIIMAVMVVGCSESVEDTKWIDEASKKIDKEITSGQFVLDGVVYEFPMDLKYWLDNGWHISNNYDNVDKFTLEPDCYSTEFELFNDNKQYVKVTVINNSDVDAKVKDCTVYSIRMDLSKVDVVFPQGITKRSKPAEIKSAYGEPNSEEKESNYITSTYSYTTPEDWKCIVEIESIDDKTTQNPCKEVLYYVMSFDMVWDELVDEKGIEEACKVYFDATMNASFIGDYTDYVDMYVDSKAGAEKLYNSEILYYSEFLRYYVDIDEDNIDDEIKARFDEVAKKVLSKVMWNVESVVKKNSLDCKMVLKLYPTNFLDIIDSDVDDAIVELNIKYDDVDFDTISDEDYAIYDKEYTEAVLSAMEKNVDKAGTKDAVTKTYEIDIDGDIISEDDWMDIDDIIMDILE